MSSFASRLGGGSLGCLLESKGGWETGKGIGKEFGMGSCLVWGQGFVECGCAGIGCVCRAVGFGDVDEGFGRCMCLLHVRGLGCGVVNGVRLV